MSKLFIIILLLLSFSNVNAIEKDKQKHLLATTAIAFTLQQYFDYSSNYNEDEKYNQYIKTFLITNSIGIVKEIVDSQEENNKFDEKDILYNVGGSLIGIFISDVVNMSFGNKKIYFSKEIRF